LTLLILGHRSKFRVTGGNSSAG